MAAWIAHAPIVLAALGVLFVPGLLIGLAARLRGLTLVALAPLITVAALGIGCLVLGVVGVGWTPLAAAGSTVVIAGAVAALAGLGRPRPVGSAPQHRSYRVLLGAAIAAGITVTTLRLMLYITDPTDISQTNDASFHLSALRFVLDTGLASPLQLPQVVSSSGMYPSGWHILASLIPQLTGAPVEVAANTISVAIGGVVWPLGLALFVRAAAGPVAAAVAAAAAGIIPAFPLLMLQWGVLYPQLLAVALLPSALATVVLFGQIAAAGWAGGARAMLLVAAAGGALMFAQPSVLMAWAVTALLFCLARLLASRATGRRRVIAWSAFVAAVVATAAIWWYFAHSIDGVWHPSTGKLMAVFEVAVNGYLGYPWVIGASILMVVGIVVAVRTWRDRWLVAAWALFAGLYILAVSIGAPLLRVLLIGPWYQDAYRLAALMPTFVLTLAGIGAAAVIGWAARVLAVRERRAAAVAVVAVAATGVAGLIVAPDIEWRNIYTHRLEPNVYVPTRTSFLSIDERALLRRLDETVPADAVIIGNPGTGMAFGYALSGRNVIPRTWTPPTGPAYDVLWTSLRDVAEDPEVCPALDAFGARYVLDFGPGEDAPGRWKMIGFDGLDGRDGFELVDREGKASLWRVTACD